jgi:hypothetical protein
MDEYPHKPEPVTWNRNRGETMNRSSYSWFKISRLPAIKWMLLACLLLFAYPGALLFFKARDAYAAYLRERSAADRVEALGAKANWNDGHVISVDINRGKFPSDMADALSGLSDLELLTQWVDIPSDDAIAKLKNLRSLRIIEFSGPGIKDTTIMRFKDVKGLKHLYLSYASITDAGLAHLAMFPSLEYLKIDGGAITDAGMSYLKNLRNLKGLSLRNVAVTDAGLVNLRSLNKLKTLRLYE